MPGTASAVHTKKKSVQPMDSTNTPVAAQGVCPVQNDRVAALGGELGLRVSAVIMVLQGKTDQQTPALDPAEMGADVLGGLEFKR